MAGESNSARAALARRKASSPPQIDWRKTCPGVGGKLAHLLESGHLADVSFRVGSEVGKGEVEVIRGHKFMLTMFSNVFEAMFLGRFLENEVSSDDTIELPDVHPFAFRLLLKYIYTGQLDNDLTTSDVLGTLYAAKKYDISELEVECTRYLKTHLSEENAVSIFQAAQLFEEKELLDEGLAFIKRNFDNVMEKEDFLGMSVENLCLFLGSDDTFAAELAIFQGVLRWADAECTKRGIIATAENQRAVIEKALPLVRFPVITSEDIALEVIPTRILTPEECTMLLQYKVVTVENRSLLPTLPFCDQRRKFSAYTAVFFDEMRGKYVDLSSGWYNKFSVSEPVSIVSFGFYGPYSVDNATYTVTIKLMRDETDACVVVGEAHYPNICVKLKEIFHVNFHHPLPVQPGTTYRAWFAIKGPLTCHGATNNNIMEVAVPVNTRYENVKFTYHVVGAHQLPEIMFQV